MDSINATFELFRQGFSVQEIALKRKLKDSTIQEHLALLIQEKKINIEELLSSQRIELIKSKIPEHETTLSAIKESLPEEISFHEIRWVLASMQKLKTPKHKTAIEKAINTFIGNHCMRKCFNHDKILEECLQKFDELRQKYGEQEITVSEFYKLMGSGAITICKLSPEKRRKIIFWNEFEEMSNKNRDFWD